MTTVQAQYNRLDAERDTMFTSYMYAISGSDQGVVDALSIAIRHLDHCLKALSEATDLNR